MTKAKKTDVATVDEKSGAMVVPDFQKQYAGQGVEAVSNTDVEIPRLMLLQSLSPQVEEGDFPAGVFFHSILEEQLGNTLKIIPIFTDVRYILWRPRHEGGGILARADDGKHWQPSDQDFTVRPNKDSKATVIWSTKPTVQESGLAAWGSSDPSNPDSQPAATKMFNVVCFLPEYPELGPCVLTLQRAAIGVGRKLMGKLKLANLPTYGQIFEMRTVKDTSPSGDFFNYRFEKVGLVQDEEQFHALRSMYENFAKEGLRIKDLESAQDEYGADVADEDGDAPAI